MTFGWGPHFQKRTHHYRLGSNIAVHSLCMPAILHHISEQQQKCLHFCIKPPIQCGCKLPSSKYTYAKEVTFVYITYFIKYTCKVYILLHHPSTHSSISHPSNFNISASKWQCENSSKRVVTILALPGMAAMIML